MSKYNFDAFIELSKEVFFFDLIQQNLDLATDFENLDKSLHKLYKDLPAQVQKNAEEFFTDFFEYTELNTLEAEKCPVVAKHFTDFTKERYTKLNLDSYTLFDIFSAYILFLGCLAHKNEEYTKYLGARLTNSFFAKAKHDLKLKTKHARVIGTFLKFKHHGYPIDDAVRKTYDMCNMSIAEVVYLQKQIIG